MRETSTVPNYALKPSERMAFRFIGQNPWFFPIVAEWRNKSTTLVGLFPSVNKIKPK